MEKRKLSIGLCDILLVVISAIFLIGIRTFFSACGPMDDGSFMTCHWAGQAVTGAAAALLLISLIHFFVKDIGIKKGLSLAIIPVAIVSALTPGILINLCMMDTMRCRAIMRPATVIISIAMIVVAGFDIVKQKKK